jgi:hypothetical protein
MLTVRRRFDMSLRTLLPFGLIAWMLFMHLRPGGRGGGGGCCGGHGSHTDSSSGEGDG